MSSLSSNAGKVSTYVYIKGKFQIRGEFVNGKANFVSLKVGERIYRADLLQ